MGLVPLCSTLEHSAAKKLLSLSGAGRNGVARAVDRRSCAPAPAPPPAPRRVANPSASASASADARASFGECDKQASEGRIAEHTCAAPQPTAHGTPHAYARSMRVGSHTVLTLTAPQSSCSRIAHVLHGRMAPRAAHRRSPQHLLQSGHLWQGGKAYGNNLSCFRQGGM